MRILLTTITLSFSAFITSSVIAAPQYDPRFNHKSPPPAHWNSNDKNNNDRHEYTNNRFDQKRVNPSRDWRVGQKLPRIYHSSRYKVDDRDIRRPNKANRNTAWYKINGDYVLVNTRTNNIIRIA